MTTTTETAPLDQTEAERVVRWRFEELVRFGYDFDAALELAVHGEIDLHLACKLVHKGCAPEIARRILL